jgi:hypothetical protein
MGIFKFATAILVGSCTVFYSSCGQVHSAAHKTASSFMFNGGGGITINEIVKAKPPHISIIDSSTSTCAFTTDSSSVNHTVQIASSLAACTNRNDCVVCVPAATGANCSINCSGTVPSSAAVASDSFNIFITFTVALTSLLALPNVGAVRIDGSITNWSEFNFLNQASPPVFSSDFTQCVGPTFMAFDNTNPLGIAATTATAFNRNGKITTLGLLSSCTFKYVFKANMAFTGANTPGATINLTRGSIKLTTKICDSTSGC